MLKTFATIALAVTVTTAPLALTPMTAVAQAAAPAAPASDADIKPASKAKTNAKAKVKATAKAKVSASTSAQTLAGEKLAAAQEIQCIKTVDGEHLQGAAFRNAIAACEPKAEGKPRTMTWDAKGAPVTKPQ